VTALIVLGPAVALLALAVLGVIYQPPAEPQQCLSHEDCGRAVEHNAATRAAFEAAGYTDFAGTTYGLPLLATGGDA
jgi:hypothetical protein